ncbi:MAG: hypothetical protein R3A52_25530 [Polyangiales bacterium]
MPRARPLALLALALLASAFAFPAGTRAHPLGMSSVNRYLGVKLHPAEVEVDYLLDLAELPAYAEIETLDADHDERVTPAERDRYLDGLVPRITAAITLTVAGQRLALTPRLRAIEAPPGQNGLSTLRLILEFRAPLPRVTSPTVTVDVRDTFRTERGGWREIEGLASDTARVTATSLPEGPRAGRALAYPTRAGESALTLRQDHTVFTFALDASRAPAIRAAPSIDRRPGASEGARLAAALRDPSRSVGFILSALALAFALGAGHALSPGHGKTLVAAYLVGSRGDLRHALLLGLTVTVTHTASVFLLGLFALAVERTLGTEKLLRTLELLSGRAGGRASRSQLPGRWRRWRGLPDPAPHHHPHDHGALAHDHGDGVTHTHLPPEALSLRSLVALGVSGGLVPCPGALVLLLAAISLHRVGFGMVLLVAFSLGLATVLTAVGSMFVLARRRFDALPLEGRLAKGLPVLSSLAVLTLGVAIIARAVWTR